MKPTMLLLGVLLVPLSNQQAHAQDHTLSHRIAADVLNATLQSARDAFSSAYVNRRFGDMAAMYTEDAVLLPNDRIVRGRAAIERYFTYGTQRTQVAHSMTPTSLTVHGRTAVEVGVWSSTAQRGDAPATTSSGRHLLVWEQQANGDWLIAYDAWHNRPPASRAVPQLVADSIVSLADRHETWPSIDPVDGSLWFSVYADEFEHQRLWRAPASSAGWEAAHPVSFSSPVHGDRAPRFSADGARLYFTSNRPVPGRPAGDLDVWIVERSGDGWGAPRPLPEPVNSSGRDMHAAVTDAGTLYLSTTRAGGRSDLAAFESHDSTYVPSDEIPAVINDERGQPDLLIAPDGSWMIVVVTDHPLGVGGDDLFLTRRTVHGWTPLEHFPEPINSAEYEYGPTLSPDGRWLYFTSHRRGTADVYRLPLPALGLDPARAP